MRAYAAGSRCLMQILTEALDDPESAACGRCSVCTGGLPGPGRDPDPALVGTAQRYLRARTTMVEARKLWPGGTARRGRIAGIANGRAVAFADDPAWPTLVAELAGPDAEPSQELRDALVGVLTSWRSDWPERPVAVVAVPSRSHPQRVHGMAAHIADVGRLPLLEPMRVGGAPAPTGVSSTIRVGHLLDTLTLDAEVDLPRGPLLLVDDVARTRWTLTVAAALLHDAGATSLLPLVGHLLP